MTAIEKPPLGILALATGTPVIGITLITPALPIIAGEFSASNTYVQLLLTMYLAMLAAGQLIFGPLSDLFGRRRFLLLGAVVYALSALAGLFVQDIFWLTTCRTVQGLGAAASLSMARAIINDAYEKQEATKAMATVQMIQAIMPILALITGGLMVEFMGWQSVLACMSALGITTIFTGYFLVKETHLNRSGRLDLGLIATGYGAVFSNITFLTFMCISAIQIGTFFSMNGFLPYRYEQLGISSASFGLYFALTPFFYLIGNSLNRAYFHKNPERSVAIGTGLCFTSIILLLITQSSGVESPFGIALPCALFGFSSGMVIANATIRGISAVSSYAGTASGLIGAMQMMSGGVIGFAIVATGGAQNINVAIVILLVLTGCSTTLSILRYRVSRVAA